MRVERGKDGIHLKPATETLYSDLLPGCNQRNASAYAELFLEDATVVGFDGSQMDGRSAIESVVRTRAFARSANERLWQACNDNLDFALNPVVSTVLLILHERSDT